MARLATIASLTSEGELLICLDSEFLCFGAEAENDPSKRVFFDLGTDREPSVSQTINCEHEFGIMVLLNSLCTRMLDYLKICVLVLPYYNYGEILIASHLNLLNICADGVR